MGADLPVALIFDAAFNLRSCRGSKGGQSIRYEAFFPATASDLQLGHGSIQCYGSIRHYENVEWKVNKSGFEAGVGLGYFV